MYNIMLLMYKRQQLSDGTITFIHYVETLESMHESLILEIHTQLMKLMHDHNSDMQCYIQSKLLNLERL